MTELSAHAIFIRMSTTSETPLSHSPVIEALGKFLPELTQTPLEVPGTLLWLGLRIEHGDMDAVDILNQRSIPELRHILGLLCMRRPAPPALFPLVDRVLWQGAPQESMLDRTFALWRVLSEDPSTDGAKRAFELARYEELHLIDRLNLLGRFSHSRMFATDDALHAFAAALPSDTERNTWWVAVCTSRRVQNFERIWEALTSDGSKLEALTYQRRLGMSLPESLRAPSLAAADALLSRAPELRDLTLARKATLVSSGALELIRESLTLLAKQPDTYPQMRSLREIAHAASLVGYEAYELVAEAASKLSGLHKNTEAWAAVSAELVRDLRPLALHHGPIDRVLPLLRDLGKRVPNRMYDLLLLAVSAELIARVGKREPALQLNEFEQIVTKEGLPRPQAAIVFDELAQALRKVDEGRALSLINPLPSLVQKLTWLGALSSV